MVHKVGLWLALILAVFFIVTAFILSGVTLRDGAAAAAAGGCGGAVGSSAANPIVMTHAGGRPKTWAWASVGFGPAGHYGLFRSVQLNSILERTNVDYLVFEKQAQRAGRCGKIDDVAIPHYSASPLADGCKFDQSFGYDADALGNNTLANGSDNFFLDVADAITSVLTKQWRWGVAALRTIKNGDNEPSRALNHELNRPSFYSRFKPTIFGARGHNESTTGDFTLENAYRYDRYFVNAGWTRDDLVAASGGVIDDYLLRYTLGLETVHPFTGVACTPGSTCPRDTCHESLTLHQHYATTLGVVDEASGAVIPNFEAAEQICDYNVGYLGDCYGAHEPCSYVDWNAIEYTTYGEFSYTADGMSGMCEGMLARAMANISALQSTLEVRYEEEVVSIEALARVFRIVSRSLADGKYRQFDVLKGDGGALLVGVTPRAVSAIGGNLVDYLKTQAAPVINDGKRGGSKYLQQPKGTSPFTLNVLLAKPVFAFTFAETHMSTRHVGKGSYHSRLEAYNTPLHRRTNIVRPVYSDYWMQEEWNALAECVDQGACTTDDMADKLLMDWRLAYPDEPSILALNRSVVLDVFYKRTPDGWHWQAPGNRNTPAQLSTWAADPIPATAPAELRDGNVCFTNSGFDLARDGWVSSAYRNVARCLQRIEHFDIPDEAAFWAEKLGGGLRPAGAQDDVEATNILAAFPNEFPRIENEHIFTGYSFPMSEIGASLTGEGGADTDYLVDHTFGPHIGVHIVKLNATSYAMTPCAWDDAERECTTAAYALLPEPGCAAPSANMPF